MAKSGLESLLEALRTSGVNTDDIGGDKSSNEQASGKDDSGSDSAKSGNAGRKGAGGGKGSIPLDLSFLDNVHGPSSKAGWVIIAVIALLILAVLYWWYHPPISINSTGVWWFVAIVICLPMAIFFLYKRQSYKSGTEKIEKSPKRAKRYLWLLAIPGVIVAVGLIGALFSNAIIPGNAQKYSEVLKTDTLDFAEDIQEVNYSEIPVIDRSSAILLGDKQLGSIPEYVSQFEISSLYSQINYHGEPVRVSPLGYADIFKWWINRDGGLPAYALVNMTTQEAEIVRLGNNPIYYSPSEPLERNISRHVQLNHPFYIFDEFSFEIDEDGHAWWICPVRTYTIGLFGGYTIDKVVLCDATTGEFIEMNVADIPEWVDRVYPAELLIEQYNWYGSYHNGWLNSFLGQEGVVRTTPGQDGSVGYNYIAKDDDVWVYTGVTSATSDSSIVGFVLVNQRTQESHFYSVSGATEASAMNSAEGQVQNLRYTATFPLLINVADQPTYFMALKDAEGLVKKFAMIDIQRYQNVAVGDTVAATQTAYEQLLATNGILSDDKDLSEIATTKGTIASITTAVVNGNSHFYIMLQGDDNIYDFALPGLLEIIKYKVGDEISFAAISPEDAGGAQALEVYSLVTDDGVVITDSGENNTEGEDVDEDAEQAA